MYDRRGGRGGFGGGFSRRPRFGGRDYDVPKPIKVGEEYDIEINEVGSKGDGIARIKNFVVFITDSKKGEKVRIKITDVRDRFALAEKVGEPTGEVASESSESSEATETPVESEEVAEETADESEENGEENGDIEEAQE